MTKMKSKKMTKSTFAIIIMAIVMVAMLAFGGTYAYFTATADSYTKSDIKTASMTLTLGDTASITAKSDAVPGEYIYGSKTGSTTTYQNLTVTAATTAKIYVFATFSASATENGEKVAITINGTDGESILVSEVDTTTAATGTVKWQQLMNGEDKVDGVYYLALNEAKTGDAASDQALNFGFAVKFNEKVQANHDQTAGETENTSADSIMGINIEVSIGFKAIQQVGYETSGVYAAYQDVLKTVNANGTDRTAPQA